MRKQSQRRGAIKRGRFVGEVLESRVCLSGLAVIDAFDSQPLESELAAGQTFAFYTNIRSDRGEILPAGGSGGAIEWFDGSTRATVTQAGGLAGHFFGMNGVVRDRGSLNYHALMHDDIPSQFQPTVSALVFEFSAGVGQVDFKLEAGPGDPPLWGTSWILSGGTQQVRLPLPSIGLENVEKIVLSVDGQIGNFYELDQVALELESPDLGDLEPVIWSYSALRSNFDDTLGIAADRKAFPTEDFGNVPATGGTALAAALMADLEIISTTDALSVVVDASESILSMPRFRGVLPHFTKFNGSSFQIAPDTEYSTVDTVITALSLIEARSMVGLPTGEFEDLLRDINWESLILPNGTISHGFTDDGDRLESGWDVWSSESFLVNLAYAASRPSAPIANLVFTEQETFDGAYFNDELASLFFDMPETDVWGNNWDEHRLAAASRQFASYVFAGAPICCLSPAEVAEPWEVPEDQIYQPFGAGGIIPANTGEELTGHLHAAPHGLGLFAVHSSSFARAGWDFLVDQQVLSPINTVESLYLSESGDDSGVVANPLKSSWNLFLQTVGWARSLSGSEYAPHMAVPDVPLLAAGIARLSGHELFPVGVPIEAEAGRLHGEFEIRSDSEASGQHYVTVPSQPPVFTPTDNFVEYLFVVESAGDYILEARAAGQSGAADSFFVGVGTDRPIVLWDVPVEGGEWVEDQVAHRGGEDPEIFSLSTGIHRVRIYHREAETRLDRIALVNVDGSSAFWQPGEVVEAEHGEVSGAFVTRNDATASGGKYRVVKNLNTASGPGSNYIQFRYQINKAGSFQIDARVLAPDGGSNSFYVTVGGNEYLWSTNRTDTWTNDSVSDRGGADPVIVDLDAGIHTLRIHHREDGTQLDTVQLVPVTQGGGGGFAPGVLVEAEDGRLSGDFTIENHGAASSGKFVTVVDAPTVSRAGDDFVEFLFDIAVAGDYRLDGMVLAPDSGSNSFYVTVDSSPTNGYRWDLKVGGGWRSDSLSARGVSDPLILTFDRGVHSIKIHLREDGAGLDAIRLVNVTPQNAVPSLAASAIDVLFEASDDQRLFAS